MGISSDTLNDLIGKQVRVTVKNKAGKDNKVFSNIVDFFPARTLINALTPDEKEKARVKNKKETSISEEDDEIPVVLNEDEIFGTRHQNDDMAFSG